MKVQFNFGMSHFLCKHCVTSCFFCLCNNGENRSYLRFRRSIGFSPFSFAWSVCLAPFFHSIDLWAKAQGFLEQPTNTKSTHAETSASTEMSSNHSWRLKKSGKITFLQTALASALQKLLCSVQSGLAEVSKTGPSRIYVVDPWSQIGNGLSVVKRPLPIWDQGFAT